LHAEGQRFESVILHTPPYPLKGRDIMQKPLQGFGAKFFDILEEVN
jgi:hypothetical protein